ncbi:WD repeat-containing protein 25 isoform X2 [Arvicanthis niloticus]|uniref:WD repeat-containing protein 25 isoform X2 n=1 Tax=Arvicanthis niloticus TaxID=61156 RepID=UPI00402B67B8
MASLVAYDDSDSESEADPARSGDTAGQMSDDASGMSRPSGIGFASSPVGMTKERTQHTGNTPDEDPGKQRLPLARLWRSDPGSCPSQRLQWPSKEPDTTFPTSEPSRPSLWMSRAPVGHVPLAAACFKPLKPAWDALRPSEDQSKLESTVANSSSSQRKRGEDCVLPYIPKRLRQLQASLEAGGDKDVEPPGSPAGCAPAPLCVAPTVSEFIQPYLNSQFRETTVPKKVLFHLRGHRGPVNSIQWCPVFCKSHMLLSASMDKTFKETSQNSGCILRAFRPWQAELAHLQWELHQEQVWNAVDSGHCLQTYSVHTEAVRAARWSPCGRRILSGGFDFALHLTDLETGTQVFSGQSDFRVTTLKFHPKDHNVFLCGGFSSEIKAWDMRTGKEGSEFLSSTDASTRDSADRTIIAWDFRTAAKISNQIFHERYTCPSLALHPREPVFLAQTNGNYLALFSSVWPYRMSRRRRYEGHKVEGYAVGCECSPCGDLLVTGSADGRVLMFSFRTARRACTLQGHTQACLGTTYHPVLPSVLGTCSWGGDIKIWH